MNGPAAAGQPQPHPWFRWLLAGFLVGLGVAVDWWSKGAAFAYHLEAHGLLAERRPLEVWSDLGLRLSLVREYNSGMAFGLLSEVKHSHVYLGAARATVLLGILVLAIRLRRARLGIWLALAGIAAGATGNLLDNLFHDEFQHEHTVRDFLLVSFGNHHLPAFNGADVWVGLGAVYLLAHACRSRSLARPSV